MKLTEIIPFFESPQMVSVTDFGLTDPITNKKMARDLLKKKIEVIEDSVDYEIFRNGDERNGNIALYNKQEKILDYLIHYTTNNYSQIWSTVTQLKLWRRRGSPYVQGVTKKIFFNYLLQRYPAIMSDGQQTDDGRNFWMDRMAEATTLGYRVALVNLNHRQVLWYDPTESFLNWMQKNQGWGSEESYMALRYLIAN